MEFSTGTSKADRVFMKRNYLFHVIVFAVLSSYCTKTIHDRRSRVTVTPESREFFGCRVNGIDFVSEASTGNVSGFCTYMITYEKTAGYTFELFSDKSETICKTSTVGITLDSVQLVEGKRYDLGSRGDKKNYGTYILVPECFHEKIEMNTVDGLDNYVIIQTLDTVKKVVTGIFNFSVSDAQGNTYQITDGIFDRHYQGG